MAFYETFPLFFL